MMKKQETTKAKVKNKGLLFFIFSYLSGVKIDENIEESKPVSTKPAEIKGYKLTSVSAPITIPGSKLDNKEKLDAELVDGDLTAYEKRLLAGKRI